jgi:hypothetical protein
VNSLSHYSELRSVEAGSGHAGATEVEHITHSWLKLRENLLEELTSELEVGRKGSDLLEL